MARLLGVFIFVDESVATLCYWTHFTWNSTFCYGDFIARVIDQRIPMKYQVIALL